MEDNKRRECVGEGEGERIIQTPKGGILACSILTCSTENMEGEGLGVVKCGNVGRQRSENLVLQYQSEGCRPEHSQGNNIIANQ